jgi:hypothetical protein
VAVPESAQPLDTGDLLGDPSIADLPSIEVTDPLDPSWVEPATEAVAPPEEPDPAPDREETY